ncbi:MFS transporter [Streptomyces sp. NBC_00820]|uniref:MFS transporter n=1 Tax=Streptomyces sp. NBC_00820 TaxID=2975842 RepID=UPI002ED650B0|nr:MFS transporter [Streptomyces sp. NBC_00820]
MPQINKARSHTVVPGRDLTVLRAAITAFFALDGFIFAGWVVRIPDIKRQTHASAGTLGLALLCVSAGAVLTMPLTGRLCRRYGSHPVTVAWMVVLALSVALPPLTHSAPALGGVLLLFGAAYGGVNVAFNSAAVDLVAALRRPVMPSFHAAFSLGGMIGAGLGGIVAGALSPGGHLLGLTCVGLAVTAVAGRALLRHEAPVPPERLRPEPTRGAERSEGRGRGLVVVFGLVALCDAYGEGAMADWGALHLRQDLGTSSGTAAAGYSCFALAMTVGRLTGTRLLERLGRARTVIAGGATAAAGMLIGSLAPSVWAALAGFAVTGIGLANLFPVAIERAGALAGPSGVAVASTIGYGGMLLGPPAIGFVAEWSSLPTALTSVAALAAAAALIGVFTRRALGS